MAEAAITEPVSGNGNHSNDGNQTDSDKLEKKNTKKCQKCFKRSKTFFQKLTFFILFFVVALGLFVEFEVIL